MKFLIFFFIIGCSSILDENHLQIDNRALPFVLKVVKPQNLIVEFTPLLVTDGVIGKTFYGSVNTIKLDTSLLTSMQYDPLFFETVLYHELGHAVLNRRHCYDCYSLMNPNKYVSDYRQDENKRKQLINELFK